MRSDYRALLETIITGKTGHEVITTNNPLELEELMQGHTPALIISDLKMLGATGSRWRTGSSRRPRS